MRVRRARSGREAEATHRRGGPRRPRRGRAASTRTGSSGPPRRRPGDAADELLPARRGGGPQAVRSLKLDPTKRARPARAAAEVRDLGLLAAGRGRAPAVRQGRPRRAALVRPARGLPHRDPRPGQGADGQERRHRPDRRARAGSSPSSCPTRRRPRRLARRGRRCYEHVHLRPARPHRQPASEGEAVAAAATSCGTTATTPTSSSRPTRARRRSPTSPTQVAAEYGFWLGDAFASGGSAGYDHKAMGITARGAWESVKRHFREMGVDTQTQDFTVVGVGDMSGDVFGNGMLLSRAHPAGRGVRPPARLRRPDPGRGERPSPSAGGCSSCPARRGPSTTAR